MHVEDAYAVRSLQQHGAECTVAEAPLRHSAESEVKIYVSRIKVDNIRGFAGTRSVDLDFMRPGGRHAGWTVIAGRNGSGKTSLLRCIALALTADPNTANAITPRYSAWRSSFDEEAIGRISADLFLDRGDLDDINLRGLPEKPGTHGNVTISIPPPQVTVGSGRQRMVKFSAEWAQELRSDESEEDLERGVFPTKNWFAAGYGPFRRLSSEIPDPRTTASGVISPTDPASVADRFSTLFHEDASLGEGVSWLVGLYLRSLENEKGVDRLLKTVLDLLSDGLLPDDYSIARVRSSGLWVKSSGRAFPLREMSDGYRTVTALVLDIVRQLHGFYGTLRPRRSKNGLAMHVPGVILIDEIDAHLHVSWQQRIGEWLKSHFPKIQFIVTTHSPYICQSADPGGLIRLPGLREESAPEVVSEGLYKRIVYGSGDDAILSELFGLDTPYSSEAENMRIRLVDLEGKVFSGTASQSEIRQYKELSGTLTSSLEARVDEVAGRLGRRI
ncbi:MULTISPECIES: AAA family ATPase [Streptomyces]|uniref:AAA family ATPase n=1 Tax=Streptomyces TaxID=1883 RepID=UPI00099CBFDD|nr:MULTISPECIES: AAA family ATPase [Streptomyces]